MPRNAEPSDGVEVEATERPDTCPICGSSEQREVLRTRSGRLVRCRVCGLVRNPDYASTPASERYSEDYFARRVYADYLAGEHQWRHEARLRLAFMAAAGFDEPVLEIGCAAGYFLDELRRFGLSGCGIEISSYAARHARDVLGLDVTVADVNTVGLPQGSQGAICLWHSLEHMSRPLQTLIRCHAWLVDGGRLFAEVPNYGSLARRLRGAGWPQLVLDEHAVQLEARSLTALLQSAGFRVVTVTTIAPRVYTRETRRHPDPDASGGAPAVPMTMTARSLRRTMSAAARIAHGVNRMTESLMRVVAEKG